MSERELKQQIDAARPQMQAAMKAMSAALPAMMCTCCTAPLTVTMRRFLGRLPLVLTCPAMFTEP